MGDGCLEQCQLQFDGSYVFEDGLNSEASIQNQYKSGCSGGHSVGASQEHMHVIHDRNSQDPAVAETLDRSRFYKGSLSKAEGKVHHSRGLMKSNLRLLSIGYLAAVKSWRRYATKSGSHLACIFQRSI